MSSQFATPEPSRAAESRQADHAEYYRQVLHDFIEMGAELARLVVQEARTVAEAAPPAGDTGAAPRSAGPESAVAFERIARAVRRSIMLARALDEPVPTVDERRRATRQRIIRTVAGKLDRATPRDVAELSDAELQERLDAAEADEAIDPQMAAEIIADICHDLGLAVVPEEVSALCARAARRQDLQEGRGVQTEGEPEPARMGAWMQAGAWVPDG
jgi:hypothetical protein